MSAGKGDRQRPTQVSREEYTRRWQKTFGQQRAKPTSPRARRGAAGQYSADQREQVK